MHLLPSLNCNVVAWSVMLSPWFTQEGLIIWLIRLGLLNRTLEFVKHISGTIEAWKVTVYALVNSYIIDTHMYT